MADIFISYAKAAPEPTRQLAADLAAMKYSFWFDERLLPIDASFGLVINDEIDKAKAVISIWSRPALRSDWVYAEALKGKGGGRLINLHTPDVSPEEIPAPFNAGHVVPVLERTQLYQSLARLQVHPGGIASEKAVRDVTEAALAFDHIKDSTDVDDFEQFLIDFADGKQFYIRLARKKIAELSAARGGDVLVAKPAEIAEVPLPQAGDVFLRIEPGMHTAPLRRIDVNAAGTLMATGSDDKTARLWALPEGGRGSLKLLRTLRVPIGDGNEGKLYAVALSPDGQWVAAGGWDAHYSVDNTMAVYIFEAATRRLVTRLDGLRNVIYHLAFSNDGARLAAMLGSGEGMRLWETAGWRLLAGDGDYAGQHAYGAAFDGANRLFTVAWDGHIRRYGADGRLESKEPGLGGNRPYSIATQPHGGKLAVGFYDTTAVEVYDARTLKRLYAADTSGIGRANSVQSVSWSADGARLYAGGAFWGTNPVLIWQDEGRGHRTQTPLSQNSIMQLLPCGDGIAAGAQDPAFGLIAADGAKRVWQEGVVADMRGKRRDAFTLSANGQRVRFGLGLGVEQPLLFDLAAFRLTECPNAVAEFAEPKILGLDVSDWEDNAAPKLNGKPIALEDYEISRALAIAPDASCFALGAEWRLSAYRADGGEIWRKAVPGAALGVNITGNGKLVAAAYGDGTIRWHRLSDGEELLALFVHAKKPQLYIAWTPKGYYAASPGAEDLIGWHVNRGFDAAPDFYPASTFASTFNRTDIVKAALDEANNAKAPHPEGQSLLSKVRRWF